MTTNIKDIQKLIDAITTHSHPAKVTTIIKELNNSNILSKRENAILSAIYKAFI